MTHKEVMQQALDALELLHPDLVCQTANHKYGDRHDFVADCPVKARHQQAIASLREALAQPSDSVEQEPVAWLDSDGFPWSKEGIEWRSTKDTYTPLYTALPAAQRKPLTDEQIGFLTTGDGWAHLETPALVLFARTIEREHGIKEQT